MWRTPALKIGRMNPIGPEQFLSCLDAAQQSRLFALAAQAVQPAPAGWLPWRCGEKPLGLLSPARAQWLAQHLPDCSLAPTELSWHSQEASAAERSARLQAALHSARAQGLLTGWRDERFSFWHAECSTPEPARPAFFSVERSGFRWLGLRSHAVHVNGFLPDGRLWCARRAFNKATDPGLLDNITAGGLPSGEGVQDCLLRELAEEAGLTDFSDHALQSAGSVRTARAEPQGWHDEVVHVFNLSLAADYVPHNQDGEVAEFLRLDAPAVLARMQAGAFTADAVQTLVQGLR